MGQCLSRDAPAPVGARKLPVVSKDATERTGGSDDNVEAPLSSSHVKWLTSPTGTAATTESAVSPIDDTTTSPFADLGEKLSAPPKSRRRLVPPSSPARSFTPLFRPNLLQSSVMEERDPEAPSDEEDHVSSNEKQQHSRHRMDLKPFLKLPRPRPSPSSIQQRKPDPPAEHANASIDSTTYSQFQKIKLQVTLSEQQQLQETHENLLQDVNTSRQLWKEYQEIQQDISNAPSSTPAAVQTHQQQEKSSKQRRLKRLLSKLRRRRRQKPSQEPTNTSNNSSSIILDFSDLPPVDKRVVDIDIFDDSEDNHSQASLSLHSETSMEQQRRLFAEKARLREIPLPVVPKLDLTDLSSSSEPRQPPVPPAALEAALLASAADTSLETIDTPHDYGPAKQAPLYRDYGPPRRTTHHRQNKHNTSADLCSLTSSGFETMAGVDILVNQSSSKRNTDDGSLVSELADDYSVLSQFRNNNDYGVRSKKTHGQQIDPKFADKLCETKLSDRLDRLEKALQQQRQDDDNDCEEKKIDNTPSKTPVKSNLKQTFRHDEEEEEPPSLVTPRLTATPKAIETPRVEQQVAATPNVKLEHRLDPPSQIKSQTRVKNVDQVLAQLIPNTDAPAEKVPADPVGQKSPRLRVVGLADPPSKQPILAMSKNEFLKYGQEENGFPDDEVLMAREGNDKVPNSSSSSRTETEPLDRNEHHRTPLLAGEGSLPPLPVESFEEDDSRVSDDVMKGYSNENTRTNVPANMKHRPCTDPLPTELTPERKARLSLAALRGCEPSGNKMSLELAEQVESQVKDVLSKYRAYEK